VATGGPSRRRDNLPAEVTSLVGRRRETAEVRRLLSTSRLVTLTGPGGIGKTRLSIAAAREMRRAFTGGTWLVELDRLTEPGLLALTTMQTLGAPEPDGDDLRGLLEYLRNRDVLLVLDNCEHLVDAAGELVGAMLRECPRLRVLATSREQLNIGGEAVFAVPALPLADPGRAVEAGERSEAMELFAQRAAAATPGFSITPDNAADIAQLCRRLDGLPLAIELAAVLMRSMSVRELLIRDDRRFELLARGNRSAPSRHQTLRGAVDWSFDLCTERERILWGRLSVFQGSFDIALAELVCAGDGLPERDVASAYLGLVDKSVLSRDEGAGPVRHRMLETIRGYGRERLEEGDTGAEAGERLRERHRDTFLELAERVEAEWFGPDQVSWAARLRAEHTNLRMALEFCAGRPGQGPAGLRIAVGLSSYWMACGQQREGRHWLDRLLAGDETAGPLRAEALCVNAHLAALAGEGGAAAALLAAIKGCNDVDDRVLANARYVAGLARLGGDPALAVTELEHGVRLERRVRGPNPHLPLALINLGLGRCILGEPDAALEPLRESQAICESRGDRWVLAWSLMVHAVAQWRLEEPAAATELLRRSVRYKQELGDLLGVALGMEFLAWTAEATGDAERAARLFGASRAFFEPLGAYLVSIGLFLRWHDGCARRVRAALGEQRYGRAENLGRELSLDEAVGYAMGEPPVTPAPPTADLQILTRRESEVAGLVAEGLSNREIANRLVIAPRTADSHVEHILTKLGFGSRSQVVAWVAQQRDRSPSR
jgi:non-specific serine/threonine protein kinase